MSYVMQNQSDVTRGISESKDNLLKLQETELVLLFEVANKEN